MSAPATAVARKRASTERAIATAATFAPGAAGVAMPLLNDAAAFLTTVGYGGLAALLGANYMNRLHPTVLEHLPASDVLRAQREPLFISTLTTGIALGVTWKGGWEGTDLLMGSVLDPLSGPGLLSLGWWIANALIPLKLRKILFPGPQTSSRKLRGPAAKTRTPLTDAQKYARMWAQHIAGPTGRHRDQELTVTHTGPTRFRGVITAPTPTAVNVPKELISAVYQIDPAWIEITDGSHAGHKYVTVNFQAPAEHDPTTLKGAWKKYVGKNGGLMAGTHIEDVQPDPNTGGQVGVVVAGENINALAHPDRRELAGALRIKNPLLVSYEPCDNPREAYIRTMNRNPLQEGAQFPGNEVLRPNKNGYIRLGRGISGHPMRVQIYDPALGAQHIIVCGVTGSGKGGTLQLIALAHHVNGSAIIYADPKGSSNPAITKMAAYSGTGLHGAMGALRIWYHGLMFRVEQSDRDQMKNFASDELRWAPLIMDEASKLLGEKAEYRDEATFIINAGATLGRSLGMPVIGANQLLQLKQWGSDAAIRDNMFYGGSLILHRSDSMQKRLIDLPENFAGCDPSDLPGAWSGERDIIFDPTKPENDPERTFGLNYAASSGAHAEMSRTWILEDATPHIDPHNIGYPADWPFWDDRDELASRSVLPDDYEAGEEEGAGTGSRGPRTTKKPGATAEHRIGKVLQDNVDPAGEEILYMHKDDIAACVQAEVSTLENTFTKMVKAGTIHRGQRGFYAYGPAPTTD